MSRFEGMFGAVGIVLVCAAAHADPEDDPRFPTRTLLTGGAREQGGKAKKRRWWAW